MLPLQDRVDLSAMTKSYSAFPKGSGERGSGISVLPVRYDDDDDENCYLLVHRYSFKSLIINPCKQSSLQASILYIDNLQL